MLSSRPSLGCHCSTRGFGRRFPALLLRAHRFHFHPKMEEILYILSGSAEQWVEREKRIMQPGEALYLPAGVIHGTYNVGTETLDFLAVLSPASSGNPVTVEVGDQEPWKTLRP